MRSDLPHPVGDVGINAIMSSQLTAGLKHLRVEIVASGFLSEERGNWSDLLLPVFFWPYRRSLTVRDLVKYGDGCFIGIYPEVLYSSCHGEQALGCHIL